MIEGLWGDDYIILFDEGDVADLTRQYEIGLYLSGYQVVGLRGWDDFILRDLNGKLFTIPTMPLDTEYLEPWQSTFDPQKLQADERFRGRIKWYIKPLVFGGDAAATDNMAWLPLETHIKAVTWWNKTYYKMKADHAT